MPGWVSGEAKRALWESANAFVLPSHVEALPMSMLEAMAHGLPVIATRVGSVPEVITDGVNGLLVPPQQVGELARAMSRLAVSPALRDQLGRAGLLSVQQTFAVERVCDALATIYESVLAAQARA